MSHCNLPSKIIIIKSRANLRKNTIRSQIFATLTKKNEGTAEKHIYPVTFSEGFGISKNYVGMRTGEK